MYKVELSHPAVIRLCEWLDSQNGAAVLEIGASEVDQAFSYLLSFSDLRWKKFLRPGDRVMLRWEGELQETLIWYAHRNWRENLKDYEDIGDRTPGQLCQIKDKNYWHRLH